MVTRRHAARLHLEPATATRRSTGRTRTASGTATRLTTNPTRGPRSGLVTRRAEDRLLQRPPRQPAVAGRCGRSTPPTARSRPTSRAARIFDADPAWSPDGTQIAFVRDAGGQNFEVWTADADGTNQVNLTPIGGRNSFPDWGPIASAMTASISIAGPESSNPGAGSAAIASIPLDAIRGETGTTAGRSARRHPARRHSARRHPARRHPARRHPARRDRLHGAEPEPERPRRSPALDDSARRFPTRGRRTLRSTRRSAGHASAERHAGAGAGDAGRRRADQARHVDLASSPLGGIPLGGIALGGLPLGGIPLGGIASSTPSRIWPTGATSSTSSPASAARTATASSAQTMLGLALQGVPLGGIPLGGIPLGGIPSAASRSAASPRTPLGGIPLGGIDLMGTPLGGIPLGGIDMSARRSAGIPLGADPGRSEGRDPQVPDRELPLRRHGHARQAQRPRCDQGDREARGPRLLQGRERPTDITLRGVRRRACRPTRRSRICSPRSSSKTAYDWETLPLPGFPIQDFSADGGIATTRSRSPSAVLRAPVDGTVRVQLPRQAHATSRARAAAGRAGRRTGEPTLASPDNELSWQLTGIAPGTPYTLAFQVTARAQPRDRDRDREDRGDRARPAGPRAGRRRARGSPSPASLGTANRRPRSRSRPTRSTSATRRTAPTATSSRSRPTPGEQLTIHLSHLERRRRPRRLRADASPRFATPHPGATRLRSRVTFRSTSSSGRSRSRRRCSTTCRRTRSPGRPALDVSDNRGLADEEVTFVSPRAARTRSRSRASTARTATSRGCSASRRAPAIPLPPGLHEPAGPRRRRDEADAVAFRRARTRSISSPRSGSATSTGCRPRTTSGPSCRRSRPEPTRPGGAVIPVDANTTVLNALNAACHRLRARPPRRTTSSGRSARCSTTRSSCGRRSSTSSIVGDDDRASRSGASSTTPPTPTSAATRARSTATRTTST